MSTKTTPISVRITPRDAEFIAKLNIDDAVTPSDKIRALLKEARTQRDNTKDLSTCLGLARKAVDPFFNKLKEQEIIEQTHSELVTVFGEWLSDMLGYISACDINKNIDAVEVERELTNRIFRLCNMIVRMGVTQQAPCYDPDIIAKSLPPLMEVMTIIQQRIK